MSVFSLFMYSESVGATVNETDIQKLEVISDEYGIEPLTTLSPEVTDSELNFANVEEFEKYLELNKDQLNLPIEGQAIEEIQEGEEVEQPFVLTPTVEDKYDHLMGTYSRYHKVSWWSPINGVVMGAASLKNIDFDYTYTKNVYGTARITKVSGIDSWQTGYHDVKWSHRGSTYSLRGSTAVSITTRGVYLLGANIGGQDFGYTWNGTWTRYVDLGKVLNSNTKAY